MTSFITLVDTKISRVAEKPGDYNNSFEGRISLYNDFADRVAKVSK